MGRTPYWWLIYAPILQPRVPMTRQTTSVSAWTPHLDASGSTWGSWVVFGGRVFNTPINDFISVCYPIWVLGLCSSHVHNDCRKRHCRSCRLLVVLRHTPRIIRCRPGDIADLELRFSIFQEVQEPHVSTDEQHALL